MADGAKVEARAGEVARFFYSNLSQITFKFDPSPP
jgi:hypothetical protein